MFSASGTNNRNYSAILGTLQIKRPVALAKLSVHTHHLSLFRVPWRFNYAKLIKTLIEI
jgi:hypothetical protein